MFTKMKERIRKTTQRTSKRIGNRIEQIKMRASHLLVKSVWRQLRKSQQPATWLKAQAHHGLRCLRVWARTVWASTATRCRTTPPTPLHWRRW